MSNIEIKNVQQSLGIIGNNPELLQALNAALQAAPYDVSVLVTGENGVGKEVFHKILHNYNGLRRHNKCIAVNCGGLPEGTIDSELFGHVRGAFTGATNDRKGYFEEADGGTIFLDEIGELPMSTQARLLRVLETGEYLRVGSSDVRKCNVRIVAATNVDLQKAILEGTFRQDLFYRLSTVTIHVPPLRNRQEDLELLFRKFANDIAQKYHMPEAIRLTSDAVYTLRSYQWPGNVRQLLHVIEEISIVESTREITATILARHLPHFDAGVSVGGGAANADDLRFGPGEKKMLWMTILDLQRQLDEVRREIGISDKAPTPDVAYRKLHMLPNGQSNPDVSNNYFHASNDVDVVDPEEVNIEEIPAKKHLTLEELERDAIIKAIERNNGNRRKAAVELGISERTIHRKLKEQDNDEE